MKLKEYNMPAPVIDDITADTLQAHMNKCLGGEGEWTSKETITESLSIDTAAGDILVINVEVGRMPVHKVAEHLNHIKAEFKTMLPENLKVIYVAMKDGQKACEFDVLKFT